MRQNDVLQNVGDIKNDHIYSPNAQLSGTASHDGEMPACCRGMYTVCLLTMDVKKFVIRKENAK